MGKSPSESTENPSATSESPENPSATSESPENSSSTKFDKFYNGTFVRKLVKDPEMLKRILEVLIVDDLHQHHQTLNFSEVMHEVQEDPKTVLQQTEHEAELLLTNDEIPIMTERDDVPINPCPPGEKCPDVPIRPKEYDTPLRPEEY